MYQFLKPSKPAAIVLTFVMLLGTLLFFVRVHRQAPPDRAGVYIVKSDTSDRFIYLSSQLTEDRKKGVVLSGRYESVSYADAIRRGYTPHPDISTMQVVGPRLWEACWIWISGDELLYTWSHDGYPVVMVVNEP